MSVSTGSSHSLLLDDKGCVWAFGENRNGELGIGNCENSISIADTLRIDYLPEIVAVACSADTYSAVLDVDGNVWTSGKSGIKESTKFIKIEKLPKIQHICLGFSHSLFLADDGTVWGEGSNGNGALTQQELQSLPEPVKIEGLPPITQISAIFAHSLFLDIEGNVWGCGRNSYNQLGVLCGGNETSAFQIPDLPKIQSIGTGVNHSVFLDVENNVWCCGESLSGQCGTGTSEILNKPRKLETLPADILRVVVGAKHTLFYLQDGLWGCGSNNDGELCQNKTNQQIPNPVHISNISPKVMEIVRRYQSTKSARKL